MKTVKILGAITFAAVMFQACQNNPDKKWDAKSSADTLNNMKDSVADPNKSITKDLVMKVNKSDAKFAVAAANGGMAEVILGKLASGKASNPSVKAFGDMMVKDHSAANNELASLAKRKGISLPQGISDDEKKTEEKLGSKNGADFDKAYVEDMIEDHKNDIKEFELAVKTCQDSDLKSFAVKTLPTLKMHLASIEKVKENLR